DVDAGAILVHDGCHIGVAVATPAGLIVPVVRDADRRSLPGLAAEIRRLVGAAREQRSALDDLRDGTFTVSNYGSLGGRFATPLIRPPEAGIMGFGAIRARPFVADGQVAARPTLPYSFSADHRLIDGDLATAFSEHVTGLLAEAAARGITFSAAVDMSRVQRWIGGVVSRLTGGVQQLLDGAGVTVVQGTARFATNRRVAVWRGDDSRFFEFKSAILATGARP